MLCRQLFRVAVEPIRAVVKIYENHRHWLFARQALREKSQASELMRSKFILRELDLDEMVFAFYDQPQIRPDRLGASESLRKRRRFGLKVAEFGEMPRKSPLEFRPSVA